MFLDKICIILYTQCTTMCNQRISYVTPRRLLILARHERESVNSDVTRDVGFKRKDILGDRERKETSKIRSSKFRMRRNGALFRGKIGASGAGGQKITWISKRAKDSGNCRTPPTATGGVTRSYRNSRWFYALCDTQNIARGHARIYGDGRRRARYKTGTKPLRP